MTPCRSSEEGKKKTLTGPICQFPSRRRRRRRRWRKEKHWRHRNDNLGAKQIKPFSLPPCTPTRPSLFPPPKSADWAEKRESEPSEWSGPLFLLSSLFVLRGRSREKGLLLPVSAFLCVFVTLLPPLVSCSATKGVGRRLLRSGTIRRSSFLSGRPPPTPTPLLLSAKHFSREEKGEEEELRENPSIYVCDFA